MSTPRLDLYTEMLSWKGQASKLQQERDALVEALEAVLHAFPYEREFIEGSAGYKAIVKTKAVLKQVKG